MITDDVLGKMEKNAHAFEEDEQKGEKSRQREKSCHHKVSIPVPSA